MTFLILSLCCSLHYFCCNIVNDVLDDVKVETLNNRSFWCLYLLINSSMFCRLNQEYIDCIPCKTPPSIEKNYSIIPITTSSPLSGSTCYHPKGQIDLFKIY